MSTLRDAMSHAALGWVKPELDETLRQVRNEVEYFAEDPADSSRMRICAGYLHQVQGTLRMVELYAPALVAEELEQLASAIGGGQVQDRDESCATLMRGSVLLPDYLERLQNGHRDIPIVLLPLLNEIRAARGAPGINESVLFAFAPESATASQEEVEHARGSLSGRNRELLDTVGNAVKEELLRIKDALDLHLRTGGQPQQLQQQVNELAAVGDTLAMMGLGVARSVVVQQRDALASVVEGTQQIDENMLLDIAGALLYVDASLDDQVAHLGAAGSGEDDPAATETRRTVEVLAHEAIANFSAAREHFVAFIETNWNHAELQDVPRLLGEVGGALRMLDLAMPADYLRGVQQYIDIELIGRQRVPSGRQLDTLADAMASLEYYLEALRDRRPGREDILEITRSSLEALRYWPLPQPGAEGVAPAVADSVDAGGAAQPLSLQPVEPEALAAHVPQVQAPSLQDLDVAPTPLRAAVPPPLPDFTFDPPLDTAEAASAASATAPIATASIDAPQPAKAAPALLFDASSAPPPAQPLWHVGDLQAPGRRVAGDGSSLTVADPQARAAEDAGTAPQWTLSDIEPAATSLGVSSDATTSANPFDPVGAEHSLSATDTPLQAFASPDIAGADATDADVAGAAEYPAQEQDTGLTFGLEARDSDEVILEIDGSAFDPVLAEQEILPTEAEAITFRFEEGELSNAEDVLSLADVAADTVDLPESLRADLSSPLPVADDSAPLQESAAPALDAADGDAAGSDEEQAHARFLAELDAAAAAFDPFAGSAAAVAPPAPPKDDSAPIPVAAEGFDGGFDDQAENIDQDIRDVFLEEFEEELGNLGGLLAVWRLQPDNLDRLRPIRRVFHTLKGSGRLVGARTLGEFAWKVESLLNRVLDGSRPASPAVVALVGQAHEALPELYAALAHGQRIGVDLQALQAIADRVAAGEETFYIPLPARAPAEAAAEADRGEPGAPDGSPQAAPAAEGEPPAAGAPANIDGVLREILEAEVQAHLLTLNGWLHAAQEQPQPVNDALLRSMHTMNGAFAMTDVPEITAVTAAAESYIKRALAAAEVPGTDALAALADAARAIEDTMRVLQHEQPRVPFQHVLAARLQALAETLPEARWQALVDVEDDAPFADAQDDAVETEVVEAEAVEAEAVEAEAIEAEAVEAEAVEAEAVEAKAIEAEAVEAEAVEAEAVEADAVEAEAIEAEAIEAPVTEVPHLQEPAGDIHGALPAPAAFAAADLSAYLDPSYADQLSSSGADTPAATETGLAAAAGTDAPQHTGEQALELTAADDLSAFLDVSAADGSAPGVDIDEDEQDDTLAAADREFDDAVSLQEALDEGLHVIEVAEDGIGDETQSITLAPHPAAARDDHDAADERDATLDDSESLATEPSNHVPLFEMEAPVAAPLAPLAQSAAEVPAAPVALDGLDFQALDRELVDIFVEEGNDLLDHCDGLVSELRNAPDDREALAGLQRDLHTLKGGARMAGINAIGDLGHSIESLLEAVAAGRTSIERSDVQLLERGFDRLHKQLTLTGEHRQALPADDLLAELEARTLGQAPSAGSDDVAVAAAEAPAQVQPLSAPVPLDAPVEDDGQPRAQQEQVRVRADLLDRLVNHAGEVAIYRSRLEQQLGAFRGAMGELERTNARLRDQLRRLDLETEAQIVARYQREQDHAEQKFDPLELDRFSTLQQLSRALNESAADLGGLQGVLDDLSRQYDGLLQQQSRVSSELQDGLMRARMVPFDGLVPRLRRVVRQAGLDTGKQVHLSLEGTHGELDRNVLDRMVAPLEHMLRNSVAHGLETPEQRRSAGKPEEGQIALRLRREGSEVVLEVADDGAGLDREAIRRRALERGLIEENAALQDSQLDNLIFSAGFSTADQVSQLAGRGVGMDVVRNEVRQLGGTVDIHSVRGQGVRFTLRLPQTLAVTQAVLVQIGETTFAVPVASVSGIGRIARERFEAGEGTYRYSGEDFTLYDLGSLVGQAPARADGHDQVPLLLVRAGDLRAAVAIDQVLGNREIVVKPVGLQIASVPGIYGATITGDGRVVVILDVAPLVRRFVANPQRPQPVAEQAQQRQVPLVMVVDDSLTMRKVTGRILERHNFEVSVARDGVEALERLEERVPDLMLLDIEMPRMDGYELATAMRADPRFRDVPIVMITSRSGEKHRQRAFEIGVQRYLGKPYQELDLMRNVYDLLGIARVRE